LDQRLKGRLADLPASASGVLGLLAPNHASGEQNCDQENACILLRLGDNALVLHKTKKPATPASASNGIHGRSGQYALTRQIAAAMERKFDQESALAKSDNQDVRAAPSKRQLALHEHASGQIGTALAPVLPLAAKDEQALRAHASKKASAKVWRRQRGPVSMRSVLDGSLGPSGASARSRVELDAKLRLGHAMDSFTMTAGALWSKSWLATPALVQMECSLALHHRSVLPTILDSVRTWDTEARTRAAIMQAITSSAEMLEGT